jgi:hypothetical protein
VSDRLPTKVIINGNFSLDLLKTRIAETFKEGFTASQVTVTLPAKVDKMEIVFSVNK